jgi:hypothetical protein
MKSSLSSKGDKGEEDKEEEEVHNVGLFCLSRKQHLKSVFTVLHISTSVPELQRAAMGCDSCSYPYIEHYMK